MKQLKYKVGDVVKFTLDKNGRPLSASWLEGDKEGRGVVIEDIKDAVTESYPVKVTNPSDWKEGHDCHGRLKGPDKLRGWFFWKDPCSPRNPRNYPSLSPSQNPNGTNANFSPKKSPTRTIPL